MVDSRLRIHGGRPYAGDVGMGSRLRRPLHNHHSGPEPESRGGNLGLNPMPIRPIWSLTSSYAKVSLYGENGCGSMKEFVCTPRFFTPLRCVQNDMRGKE